MIPFHITLKTLRQGRGLSQEQLAEALGTSRQTISKWESGAALPDAINLLSLSDFFAVSTDTLLRGVTPDPEPADRSPDAPPIDDPFFEDEACTAESTADAEATPAQSPRRPFHLPGRGRLEYEYISQKKLFGMPLLHVHVGAGLYRAKGVFALGMISSGLVSMGLLSMGLLSFGLLSLGLLAFGGFVLGGAAFGGVAAGILAAAGISIGIFSIGGISLGVIAVGGIAIASKIAVGGLAIAPTSLDVVKGVAYVLTETGTLTLTPAEVEEYLRETIPYLPDWLVKLIAQLLGE
jgi:transcriptional regulator with XRE-family HTH domain